MAKVKNNRFWKNKTVLVTGHEGFLGSWLAKTLVARGAKVVGLDKVRERKYSVLDSYRNRIVRIKGDVCDLKLVERIIKKFKPEVIFHLAAEAIVDEANKNPIRAFKSNIEGTWNILEAARGKKFIEAIVAASSDKAYGSHESLPYTENAALKGAHPYDASKSCADLLCNTYHNTYAVPVCVTRCGNIFGPGDHHFSRIVPDAVNCAIRNDTFFIRSDGTFTRDYIYIEDIVSGYMQLAENLKKKRLRGEAFNFSNEKPISVLKLVKTIYALAGKKPRYKILNSARHEIKNQYLSSRKARSRLGWKPAYELDEGIVRTIGWYRECKGA
jgi:CDP-glucose 4,6-dehydratase